MEVSQFTAVVGIITHNHLQGIKTSLEEHGLSLADPRVSQRIGMYLGMMGPALQDHLEHAINEGQQSFKISGTMTHLEGIYPFEIFRPFIKEVAQVLCPGIQISFGEEKKGRFLARDMYYGPIIADLPAKPMITLPSGNTPEKIKYNVTSGGRTTGHMRYPHMYLDMRNRIKQLPPERHQSLKILLLGAGLMEDAGKASVQCPQLYELGGLARHATITVLDNDSDLLTILRDNLNPRGSSNRPLRYEGWVLPRFCEANEFSSPQDYSTLSTEMYQGIGLFLNDAKVELRDGDIRTFPLPSGSFKWVVATNSLSNVIRHTDPDAVETKGLLDLLAKYITCLELNGCLYVDEPALTVLEERLGSDSIQEVILPQLRYASKSEVSLTRLECPIESNEEGVNVINSYINVNGETYVSPVVTHNICVLQRGKTIPNSELPIAHVSRLQDHFRQSVKFPLKQVDGQAAELQQVG
ncbi:MAG: hypothetical protein Q8K75_09470 [Chlamydiales bacterium]|nr:hypothetical protein [Chlamydiales bacterium]